MLPQKKNPDTEQARSWKRKGYRGGVSDIMDRNAGRTSISCPKELPGPERSEGPAPLLRLTGNLVQ